MSNGPLHAAVASQPQRRSCAGKALAAASLAVPLALFLALALPRLFQIAGQDEILHYVGLGQRLYQEGFRYPAALIVFSPHLYGWLICLAHHALGPGIAVARLPGVLAWVITLGLVWAWLARPAAAVSGPVRIATLALLATLPLALQAGVIVDIDNTVLVPAVLLLCLATLRALEQPRWPWFAAVTAALTLALWCRLTTPTLLIPVLLTYAWLCQRRWRLVAALAAALALGWLAFAATWWLYCRHTGVGFAGPFHYLADALVFCTVGENRGVRPGKIALTVAYTLLWVGPWVAVLWAWAGLTRLRRLWSIRRAEPADALLLAGTAILGGYCLIGGTLFGFPKYHSPAIPLLLLAAGLALARAAAPQGGRGWLVCLALAVCGAVVQAVVVRDPLYVLRLDLREAALFGHPAGAVVWRGLILPLLAAGGGAVALLGLVWRFRLAPLPWAVAALALGTNLGFAGTQLAGGYQTGYNYGDHGDARATVAFLAAHLPPDRRAIVPGEIVYLLGRPAVNHVANELWLDETALRRELERPEVGAVAVSLLTNTAEQMRLTTRTAATCPGYFRHDIGRYVVFLKASDG